jgi:hypothetical protein
VVDVDAQDVLEVAAVEDQQPVEALDANGSDKPLGDGVGLRRPHRRLHDPDAAGAEYLVEEASRATLRYPYRTHLLGTG